MGWANQWPILPFEAQLPFYNVHMTCMTLHLVRHFLVEEQQPQIVSKLLLDQIIPTWKFLLNYMIEGLISQDKEICKMWTIAQHFHCAYHRYSSGLVDRTNGIIKN